ncbi:unnamed protein product, partial [marine sediment metagenome]
MTTEIEALKNHLKKNNNDATIWIKLGYAYF